MRNTPRRPAGSRPSRVGSLIRRELADLLLTTIGDPRVVGVTLSEVDVSPDLKQAKVFVTHHRGEAVARLAVVRLNKAARFLRRELARRLVLRVAPNIVFVYDASVDQGFRIDALLRQARLDDKSGETGS